MRVKEVEIWGDTPDSGVTSLVVSFNFRTGRVYFADTAKNPILSIDSREFYHLAKAFLVGAEGDDDGE
jgi:hypothetical protein